MTESMGLGTATQGTALEHSTRAWPPARDVAMLGAWLDRWREASRRERERSGDSAERLAERHAPPETVADRMLTIGGVERPTRFPNR
jgi:hypothetical protein